MFNVINLDTKCLFEIDGSVQTYPTGPDAARVATMLTNDTGSKHQPRRAAATTDWRERERKRFCDGAYIKVPWSITPTAVERRAHIYPGLPEIPDHFVHMSKEEPGKVAFTEDEDKGAADRQTRMRPGRYLERFFPTAYSDQRDYWRTVCSRHYDPTDIRFADTEEEIVRVYTNGPTSCMAYAANKFVNGHPTRIYAAGDLAIAYLVNNQDEGDKITARALCWPSKKVYGRIYGDEVRLEAALGRLEYRKDTGMEFEGARLLKIEHRSGYAMPYIDNYGYCSDEGEFLTIGGRHGDIDTQVTDGVTNATLCPHCENQMDEENSTYVRDVGENWCEDCVGNDTFLCEGSEDIYSNGTDAIAMSNGETWSAEHFERYGVTCEATGACLVLDDSTTLQDGRVWANYHFERHGYRCAECGESFEIGMRCDDCVTEDETPTIADRDNVPEQLNFDASI